MTIGPFFAAAGGSTRNQHSPELEICLLFPYDYGMFFLFICLVFVCFVRQRLLIPHVSQHNKCGLLIFYFDFLVGVG